MEPNKGMLSGIAQFILTEKTLELAAGLIFLMGDFCMDIPKPGSRIDLPTPYLVCDVKGARPDDPWENFYGTQSGRSADSLVMSGVVSTATAYTTNLLRITPKFSG